MKSFLLLTCLFALSAGIVNGTTHIITNSGFEFVPDVLTITLGDTVVFQIASIHTAREVSEATWNVNGTTSNGGFDLPGGGGTVVPSQVKTYYYVCVPHASSGMKGRIIVNNPVVLNTITIRSFADQDGNRLSIGDRATKKWNLKLYRDSSGTQIPIDSVASASSITVNNLSDGSYIAIEADSVHWSHIDVVVDAVSQGGTAANQWTISVAGGQTRTVDFINTAPNIIINTGFTFSPDTLLVDVNDTVRFVLESIHNAREVSKTTWLANGNTSNGGFETPFGEGNIIVQMEKIYYYVCVPHASGGMKGIIVAGTPPNTVTIRSFADQDGNHVTAGDRAAKTWNLKLYRDSLGVPIPIDSTTSGSSLTVSNLPTGTYIAQEADSSGWSHKSIVVDGISQGATSGNQWTFNVLYDETRTIDFINFAPHTIINVGFTFVPESITVGPGDTVRFILESIHNAREVGHATWEVNGTTSNGGFETPFGEGAVVLPTIGTYYYVCVPHGPGGMKGRIVVSITVTVQSSIASGWNLLSVPVTVGDGHTSQVYPTAISNAFKYTGRYEIDTVMAAGLGYWLKFDSDQTVLLTGLPIVMDSIDVEQGWNMIGSISEGVAVQSIMSDPPSLVTSRFFGYSGSYQQADTIEPGHGYWVKVKQSGKLILSSAAVAAMAVSRIRIIEESDTPPAPPLEERVSNRRSPIPNQFVLEQNYPNPFNPSTEVRFEVPVSSFVSLKVYDMLGREIATLVDEVKQAGEYTVWWYASEKPGGVYFYQLQAGAITQTKSMVLIK